MKIQPPDKESHGTVSLRTLVALVAFCALPALLLAQGPAWWTTRNVLITSGTANDYGAVNQGQLKHMAVAAYQEFANLPGGIGDTSGTNGTGTKLNGLIMSWGTFVSGTFVPVSGTNTNDYAPVNIGQLKNVASIFYNRLIEVGYTGQYPWAGAANPANDYSMANIGQVKNLFNIDLIYDSMGDGVPDWWETYYFGSGTDSWLSGTAMAPSGSGLTILQSYTNAVSPTDFYNGVAPTLTIVSGTNQTSAAGVLLTSPLVVQVTGTSGSPMVNAPVVFEVTQGVGLLAPDGSGTSATSGVLQALTGTNGYAQVYFQQPFDAGGTSTIAAYAGVSEADFNEMTLSDTNTPAAPSNVAATVQDDGSVLVTWQDNSDNAVSFTLQQSIDGGSTWQSVAIIAAGTTGYLVSGLSLGFDVLFSVAADNAAAAASSPALSPNTPVSIPIPVPQYVVIDLSGTGSGAPSGVMLSPMSMNNSGAIACYDYSGSNSYIFQSGTWGPPISGIRISKINNQGWYIGSGTLYNSAGVLQTRAFLDASGSNATVTLTALNDSNSAGGMAVCRSQEGPPSNILGYTFVSPGEAITLPAVWDSSGGSVVSGTGWYSAQLGTIGAFSSGTISAFEWDPVSESMLEFPEISTIGGITSLSGSGTGRIDQRHVLVVQENLEFNFSYPVLISDGTFVNNVLINDANFTPIDINNNNMVAGNKITTTHAQIQSGANGPPTDLGPGNVIRLNNATTTLSGSYGQVQSPQVLGNDGGGNPTLWTPTGYKGTGTFQYTGYTLDNLIPQDGTWSINNATDINDSGAIVGTAYNNVAADGIARPVLLLPVQVVATNLGNHLCIYGGVVSYGWNNTGQTLTCPLYQITATIKPPSGLQIQLSLIQDIIPTCKVTYYDGSYTYCQSGTYLPDDGDTIGATNDMLSGTNIQGIVTGTYQDYPTVTITAPARRYITQIQYSGTARDFVTVQVGNSTPQVISEVNWSYVLSSKFTYSKIPGINTQYQPSAITDTNPTIGGTFYGGLPTNSPISSPRTPTASTYIRTGSNWHPEPIGNAENFAHQYPFH